MNEGQYDSKNVEHISIENIEVVSNGMDWKSRHLEAEREKPKSATESISRLNRARNQQKIISALQSRPHQFMIVT